MNVPDHDPRRSGDRPDPSAIPVAGEAGLAIVRCGECFDIKPAGRHFGLHYRTVRVWRSRWQTKGEVGLVRARRGATTSGDVD